MNEIKSKVKIYLDENASTALDPEVGEAIAKAACDFFGNPSSLHWAGAKSRRVIEDARERVAELLGAAPREILFTSGGTESVNLALKGTVWSFEGREKPHVVTSTIEHKAVLESLEFVERMGWGSVTYMGVDSLGRLSIDDLEKALLPDTRLLSLMMVNNEVGNVYPIADFAASAARRGIAFHVDAVQALGKVPIDLRRLPVSLMSFSSHKIHGPAGTGVLFIRKGTKLSPLIHGGPQELEKRGGTENLLGIVGFTRALELALERLEDDTQRIAKLRDHLQKGILEIAGAEVHGDPEYRVANTLNVSFSGIGGETLLMRLDQEGIAVSAGSACASGALEPSHVLLAMGIHRDRAKGAIRFSLGRTTTEHDIQFTLEKVKDIVRNLQDAS